MTDTPVLPDSRSVAMLRQAAATAPNLAEQQRLIHEAEGAQQQINAKVACDREIDLVSSMTTTVVPGRVHELHTTATDWLGAESTGVDLHSAKNAMVAKGSVWYQALPTPVRIDTHEFVEQARGFAARHVGSFGVQADVVEQAFFEHVATLRDREINAGLLTSTSPMPSQPGDPAGTFTSGGGQDWLPGDATSSNRAPQMQELETESPSQDVVPENDPGLGNTSPDPAVTVQEKNMATAATLTGVPPEMLRVGVGPSDLEALPRCAVCDQPVSPIEMAHTANNQAVHGSCVGITGSQKEGHTNMQQTAPCPTCGTGRVAVRQAPQPNIVDLVAGRRTANSGLPQIDQTVDPSDTQASPTPLPDQVAWPWTMVPGQVEHTIGEAEQQLAEREQRKGATLRRQASAAAREAFGMAYHEVVRQGMARFDPQGTFDPMVRHATLARRAQELGQRAAQEAARLVMQGGQDDSGWLGDMGQGGVAPGQQDGGNPVSNNLGQPDPVYGYGGDNGNQPLKPYGADEADDVTNNPGMGYQPGQPLQYDQGGRQYSTETPAGGGTVPKQSALSEVEANDPELQRALTYARHRRAFLAQQNGM